MKVIKRGDRSNIFPIRVQCEKIEDEYGFSYSNRNGVCCGSELEVEAEDIRKHKWSKYPDYSGVDFGVVCPVCGQFIVLNARQLPRAILENAPEIHLR